ncbi:MAG: SGNH/GDSL hydrolase family protein [Candidatus Zixiibacteriota bacterium]|nr:MAG: SGNH/GDSL hydrolase family protein [candidate division Zixibacteria bacterium]
MENEEKKQKGDKTSRSPRFARQLFRAPVLLYMMIILLAAEFSVVAIAPLLVPDCRYLRLYLNARAEECTRKHLDGTDRYNIRCDLIGWRNRPNCTYRKWEVDEHGARTTHAYTTISTKPNRVMFMGSSMINGGPFVYTNETISALIEDSTIEAINFGTMRYSLDQVYLHYKNELNAYHPNILVVEIPGSPDKGLRNQYVLFRNRYAGDMPYLKPRFTLESDELVLVPVPPKEYHDSIFCSPELLRWLEQTDGYYNDFRAFKRFGHLPIANTLWYFYQKARNLYRLIMGDYRDMPLLEVLMARLVDLADKQGVAVTFIMMPDRTITAAAGWRKFLPDHYKRQLDMLESKGFDIIDGREVLRRSGIPFWKLYASDNQHYSPAGNLLLAEALKERLDKNSRKSPVLVEKN